MTGSRGGLVILQARDRKLLSELGTMRVIDREQAKLVAGFGSTTRANTRLLALTRAGFLKRIFIGTITSGRKAVYGLTLKGALEVQVGLPKIRLKQDYTVLGNSPLEHQSQINSLYLSVKYLPIPFPGVRFYRWITITEPLSKALPLIPDGYFELETPSGIRVAFLEVDLGTEALPVWEKKIQFYLQLALSGEFARLFRNPQFRVLVILNSERRLENLRKLVAKKTDKIFWFSSFATINRDSLWSSVWLRPTGNQTQSLL